VEGADALGRIAEVGIAIAGFVAIVVALRAQSGAARGSSLTTALVLCTAASAASDPLNIVFILSDNQAATALGAYGNRDVKTPHIDELARSGVRFDRAYAVNGMCSPTRASLLTGLMPSQHGLHDALSDPWVEQQGPGWSAIGEYRTLPATLAERGYQTAMIGKWHLGDPKNASAGFQYWVALPYGHTTDFWRNELVENGRLYRVDDRHIVDEMAQKAVEYLESVDEARPFYLQLNLDGPYALPPSNYGPARNRHYARHVGQHAESMPLEPINDHLLSKLTGPFVPGERLFELDSLEAMWNHLRYRTIRMQGDPESYANFLSQNEIVDDAVGRVRAALRERGLDQRTVFVYSADQGNLFGQHGTWGHTTWFSPAHLYEEAMRIPLIVVHPNGATGSSSDGLVSQVDFAPTVLDWAGVDDVGFENSPGRSFAKAVSPGGAASDQGANAVFFEQEETRGIRMGNHVYWKRLEEFGDFEIYDLEADPGQEHNLHRTLSATAYGRARIAELDTRLEAFFAEYSHPDYDLWKGGGRKGMLRTRPGAP
jgi:arylsulfatase A-like enzyme